MMQGGRERGEGRGCPQVPYISVILHGLLQGAAGQLRLRPVPQPAVQGLQVGLHAGAPGEVLQRGKKGEETKTLLWEQRGSPSAPPAHRDRHWAAPASSMAACAGGQRGPGKVLVPGPEGLGAVACPPHGGEVPACMFRLRTLAPSEGGKKPLWP